MPKVFVTGGCGFLGSHVCEEFIKDGNEVVAYDNLTKYEINRTPYNIEKIRNYNIDFLKKLGVQVVVADIRDFETLRSTMKANKIEFVMHCAAQPAMTISTEDIFYDFSVNAKGTLNVLESCKRLDIGVINCSSIHVYGKGINKDLTEGETRYIHNPDKIKETQPILTGELTPLHASKFTAETYTRTYAECYGLKAATFRLTGIYGERQTGTEDHSWMSLLAIKVLQGVPIRIINTGKQVRDPVYVKDVVEAIKAWLKAGMPAGIYNIGGSSMTMTSILEYLELLYNLTGKKSELIYGDTRQGDLYYFVCDTYKAKKVFGWQAKTSLDSGVSNMLEWLNGNMDMFKVNYK